MSASSPIRLAIFASGSGSNAAAIYANALAHPGTYEVALIVTDRPDAFIITRFAGKVPVQVINRAEKRDAVYLHNLLGQFRIDLIALAGYLSLVPPELIRKYQGRILNIHPSLLPKFGGKGMYGHHVHTAVLDAGETESGITIHEVNEEYDRGQILFQATCSTQGISDPKTLAERIHALEHQHYPRIIREISNRILQYRMSQVKPIRSALVSVFHKQGLDQILHTLHGQGVTLYSTGGTCDYISRLGLPVTDISDVTGFPSILDGRVKTLHPAVFGGILARREMESHREQLAEHHLPTFDLVIVDLYPFEQTVASGAEHQSIIEKIDIGGISLIRAAAKNYHDVVIVPSQAYYFSFREMLATNRGAFSEAERAYFAAAAFAVSSHYDTAIFGYLQNQSEPHLRISLEPSRTLRYGENPHQKGWFHGDLNALFEQLHGKELSYNNIMDADAALSLVREFSEPVFAIIKHTNPCGLATGSRVFEAWNRALECDPLSAFGGILCTNQEIDAETAREMDKIFFELCIAPAYTPEALEILKTKKNRMILRRKAELRMSRIYKSALNGMLEQAHDDTVCTPSDYEYKTGLRPDSRQIADVRFGEIVCKHLKSNAIAIVKNQQVVGVGMGQTSRIDALRQAIAKAGERGFSLEGSVLVSDAFFPFSDSAEIAFQAGIRVIAEPGGSVRDQDTVDFCERNQICLIFNKIRHFKH